MARNNRSTEDGESVASSDVAEAAPVQAEATAPAPVSTEPQPPATEQRPKRFVVAPGCDLVGARGKLGPGTPIRDGEFTSEQLEGFVRDGHVVEA